MKQKHQETTEQERPDRNAAFYQEEKNVRATLVAKSPEYKANLLDMFFYLYKFTTGDEPTAEKLEEARSIQHRFFISNPQRTLCNPDLLKTIIPVVRGKKINGYEAGFFRFAESAVRRDMQLEPLRR
jgi:hypothetical protein